MSNRCGHRSLSCVTSANAAAAGFVRKSPAQLLAALQPSGRVPQGQTKNSEGLKSKDERAALCVEETFPGPLVLPGDELALDPKYPPQSLLSWTRLVAQYDISQRKTIYVAIASAESFIAAWSQPVLSKFPKKGGKAQSSVKAPALEDVADYLQAFYHGVAVKPLETPLKFTTWDDIPLIKRSQRDDYPIGLATDEECICIRTTTRTRRSLRTATQPARHSRRVHQRGARRRLRAAARSPLRPVRERGR